jgi:hypothetical protein
MIVEIPIADVDSLVDLVLSKKANIAFQRKEAKKPPKIIYTVSLTDLQAESQFLVTIRRLSYGTDVDFPIYFPPTEVFPTPELPDGGFIELGEGKEPEYIDPIDQAQYKLCHSIWVELKLQEWESKQSSQNLSSDAGSPDALETQKRGKSGRSGFKDDLWAWEQVNRDNRPKNDVFKEWIEKIKADPRRCNMVDPKRQFNRITSPMWGNKSGRFI